MKCQGYLHILLSPAILKYTEGILDYPALPAAEIICNPQWSKNAKIPLQFLAAIASISQYSNIYSKLPYDNTAKPVKQLMHFEYLM
jgi:hypothetical protein